MKILIVNAGSSSLKYQLFDMENQTVMAKGLCERIGIDGRLKHSNGNGSLERDAPMKNHGDAIKALIEIITSPDHGCIKDLSEISAVGHRVLHGGEAFSAPALIDEKVIKAIEDCIDLGPLHNPPNLTGIRACEAAMPGVPQVAVFDTAFHQTMPETSYLYALPYDYYRKHRVRRYGFHGTSHRYVSRRAAEFLGRDPKGLRIITCHMGNGSSISAVKNGRCFDTSMGLTPLEGVMMGTRSGSIDPAILQFVMGKENLSIKEMTDILNKKSGVLGISEVSSDFRDVEKAAKEGNRQCKLALDMFVYQIRKYIGSYAAAMGGVDAIVFTAGIGENNGPMRYDCVRDMEYMGIMADPSKNGVRGVEADISLPQSKVRVLVIPTNEELMIALDTKEIVESR